MFEVRNRAPNIRNSFWISHNQGGYNPYTNNRTWQGHALVLLPNCTTYCAGRIAEVMNITNYRNNPAPIADGGLWWSRTSSSKRGQQPRVGAIACWSDGGEGHVAFIENIVYDSQGNITRIDISESSYAGYYSTYYFRFVKIYSDHCVIEFSDSRIETHYNYRLNSDGSIWKENNSFQGYLYLIDVMSDSEFISIITADDELFTRRF